MFTEYCPQRVQAAQRAKKAIASRCRACAMAYAPELFADVASRISTPQRLAQFLEWVSEHYRVSDLASWVKAAMHSHDLDVPKIVVRSRSRKSEFSVGYKVTENNEFNL